MLRNEGAASREYNVDLIGIAIACSITESPPRLDKTHETPYRVENWVKRASLFLSSLFSTGKSIGGSIICTKHTPRFLNLKLQFAILP